MSLYHKLVGAAGEETSGNERREAALMKQPSSGDSDRVFERSITLGNIYMLHVKLPARLIKTQVYVCV